MYIWRKQKEKTAPSIDRTVFSFSGDGGDRTHDLLNAIQALSQLSYTPEDSNIIPRETCFVNSLFSVFLQKIYRKFNS